MYRAICIATEPNYDDEGVWDADKDSASDWDMYTRFSEGEGEGKVSGRFQVTLVAFWGLSRLPKLPSGFPGVVPRRIQNGGIDPPKHIPLSTAT